ncbi:ARABIDOPSIS THALIANA BETA-1,2-XYLOSYLTRANSFERASE, beta-1,2-xylosyltransferase [Hibiscus trionum]|uniref:ARABIDOPSIS THALIANA BETA-1,2-XYLOSYLTRANSFERASE, beta-1,2-xylosyltransferase n=1 Tax=Hibiscus trionum TaxID=183268 RepID=A0A9W7MVX3_HIBTR|nr:ARABIDOPSIS THALIANA BETA-1,2-XYLOSYLTRANSFERASE, beta-1,2-xylosyltransferase [Hibiscus trionum]
MNSEDLIFIKIILPLFALNSVILYHYFSSLHPTHHRHHRHLPVNHHRSAGSSPINIPYRRPHLSKPSPNIPSKPWPITPSYLPWSLNPTVALNSCEAYFGNGFTMVADILPAKVALRNGSSWFRCHYSETLRSSICEGGKIRMDPGKIKMSRGGESLEDVIGRKEEEELPVFKDGAFMVQGNGGSMLKRMKLVGKEFLDEFIPVKRGSRHPIREAMRSTVIVGANNFDCHEWVEEPTLLVTRFEYANLYHTVTDWYSAYVSSRVTGLPFRPHLVFVDGHCQTQLEETWKALFSSLRFAKSFTGPVCFRHAIFSPLGYETPLFRGLSERIKCRGVSAHDLQQSPDIHKTARLSEFGEMITAAFGLPVNRHRAGKAVSGHNVLFVRRENYLAHPRHEGKVEPRLSNEQEVFNSLSSWASNHPECKVNLINGLFAYMPMKEQVRAIQDASVIIGAHGAGLTHLVSATPNTVLLEIISKKFQRPHFQLIARWKGLESYGIYLHGSYANPQTVITRLNRIIRRLGC